MFQIIAYSFQAISGLLSSLVIYKLLFKNQIHNLVLNRFLVLLHVVNVIYQIGVFLIYQYDNMNPKWWSLMWLIEINVMAAIVYISLLILKIFSVLRPEISEFKLKVCQGMLIFGTVVFSILPFTRLVSDIAIEYTKYEELNGSVWVLICMTYHTIQAVYLTFIVYVYGRDRGVINSSSKGRVVVNLAVIMIEWTAIAVFMYQSFDGSTDLFFRQLVQQIAIAMTGIHFTFTFLLFQNFTELSLGERAYERHEMAKRDVRKVGTESKTAEIENNHTSLSKEDVLSIQWSQGESVEVLQEEV